MRSLVHRGKREAFTGWKTHKRRLRDERKRENTIPPRAGMGIFLLAQTFCRQIAGDKSTERGEERKSVEMGENL